MNARLGKIGRGWQRVRTEPGLFRNVAVLAALIVLAALVGGIILANQRFSWPWNDRFTFSATFEDTPGVSPGHGQEVRIAGVQVGEIEAAGLDDSGRPRLELSIDSRYPVYQNATVVLRPKSPLNEMYVELSPGGPPAPKLDADGVLPVSQSQRPVQIDEVLGHLDDNTRQALATLLQESDVALAAAPQNLPGGVRMTDEVAKKLQPVVESLQSRRDALQRLVTALSQISQAVGGDGDRLGRLAGDLNTTLAAVGAHNGDLKSVLGQLPDFTRQLKQATDAVQSLSGQLDPTLDNLKNAAGTLPGALNKLSNTVGNLGSTVDKGMPVVQKARPVVQDLRPVASDLQATLPDLRASTSRLNGVTSAAVSSLSDLGAFFVNTRSLTSMKDGNGGILRGFLVLTPQTLGTNALLPLSTPAAPYRFPHSPR
ncbi:MAG TPA: MlaD family protein [Amycolatopsis sp.]|uniref:MlaD family protein n=1 Tax=unclassified Amycolatopsis TaxID=2618356 RepID=UPI00106E91BD|nr:MULTISPECIES: MlaD family protein [unclassified Amycolatopsis]HWD05775.1 MlaD family protein [Amycolatopsis sp.]